jgi:ABC-type siderophore export system fused ATPase/permease subunit
MKARSALVYTVLRLLAFLVPFGILMLFPIFRELYWLAAIFAALIGLSLSLLFLRRPLTEVTTGLAQRRAESKAAVSDEDAEDAAIAAADRRDAADSAEASRTATPDRDSREP